MTEETTEPAPEAAPERRIPDWQAQRDARPTLLPELDERGRKRTWFERLRPRRRRFVLAYLAHGENGSKAAAEIWPNYHNPPAKSHRVLLEDGVRQAIDERRLVHLAEMGVNATRVLQELSRVAFFDPRKLFSSTGGILPPSEWPDEVAAAIAGLDVEALWEGSGRDRTQIGDILKYKAWPKVEALTKLAMHLKLITEKREVSGPNGGPIPTASVPMPVDPTDAAQAYQDMMGAPG